MVLDLEKYSSSQSVIQSDNFILRTADNGDAASVGELASYCFRGLTRFYKDPRFSDDKCDELYRIWAERDIRGSGNYSLICTCEGSPVGFCTVDITGDGSAKIGLIGVIPDFRGFGLGQVLLNETAGILRDKSCGHLLAVTQLESAGAMRMYERAGFLLRDTSIVVHCWGSM